ncbi:SDR family oxidoreductase [Lichenicoccus sp.]|uniref:SDR family oxidoreductase n=1 Tax=Lichenicoccus sp. TaxID=2781899 RepID=UPI003D0FC32E
MGKLDGKVAVVTGGSAGMGLATAKLFVHEGAKVVITGRDQALLDAAVCDIGDGVEAFRSDISILADLEALRVYVETKHSCVDVVFANAGGGRPGLFEHVSEDDFDFTINTNFRGTFFTVQTLVSLMPAGGSVILNTSILGAQGRPGFSVYAATKAAIRSLARSLTAELSAKGIRVNALLPGHIDTDIMRKAGLSGEMIEQVNAQAHAQIPMGRSGTSDEVAKAVLFLASDDAAYVTGVELPVDGGWAQV